MSLQPTDLADALVLTGPQFSEPMRVVGIPAVGNGFEVVNLVGTRTQTFRSGVTLSAHDRQTIRAEAPEARSAGNPRLVKLGVEALRISLAQEYDPFFGLPLGRVDPLPHQLDAVYNHLLKSARVRFLLADDAGAGKTIMAGLLLKELKLRGLVERVLIVCPANLAFQWQREMADKFQENFQVLRDADLRLQYGVNEWNNHAQIITSMDLAKREEILPSLRQAEDWDLIMVDEAHRMSARDAEHKSERYRLGEQLRDKTAHFLLLSATPHKGDPVNFTLFLQLLDQEAYADVKSIRDAIARQEAACYLRRTKEVMLNFPKPQADGTWKAEKLFKARITRRVAFCLEGEEMDLYNAVSHYVKQQSARAAEAGDERRAIGFTMAMYQRRMARSTYALRQSLLRREKGLKHLLATANPLGDLPLPDLPTDDESEEMDDAEREAKERELERATLARRKPDLEAELKELADLIAFAQRVEDGGHEIKLRCLKEQLTDQGVFADRNLRLLLFTEYKDTLDYLVARLKSWGLTVGQIHGDMKPGTRDEEGSRLWSERNFWELKTQVLAATEAAGEASISSAATSCSITTSRGTRTAWSSAWAASTATASPRTASSSTSTLRTPSKVGSCKSWKSSSAPSATRWTTIPSSTSSARSCPPTRSNACSATSTRVSSVPTTSKPGSKSKSARKISATSATPPSKDWPSGRSTSPCSSSAARWRRNAASSPKPSPASSRRAPGKSASR